MIIEVDGVFFTVTLHAEGEMLVDNVTEAEIVFALKNEPVPSKYNPDRWVYSYNDVRVIVNEDTEQIVTVFRIKKDK